MKWEIQCILMERVQLQNGDGFSICDCPKLVLLWLIFLIYFEPDEMPIFYIPVGYSLNSETFAKFSLKSHHRVYSETTKVRL